MKKTKLLALASLLLVAGLVGCGGNKESSEAPKSEAPTSQTTEKPSETPATSEKPSETPATSEKPSETPATSATTEKPSTPAVDPSVTYEATPALTGLPMNVIDNYTLEAEVENQSIVFGDFTLNCAAGKKTAINANKKTWNGVEYTHRINSKSGDNTLTFNAAKAGKLVMIAMSSSKTVDKEKAGDGKGNRNLLLDGTDYGLIPLSTDAVTTLVEIPFSAAGTHTFQAKGGAWYCWAAWVYYVA